MIHREQGKKWTLPSSVTFEHAFRIFKDGNHMPKWFRYRVKGFRYPRKGEWYLSGAFPSAWLARNDLTTKYLVVEATHRPIKEQVTTTKIWIPV